MMRVAVICARGGSKGVPGKNIRPIAGKPLIYWTISKALASNIFDHVIVSSDAPEILDTAKSCGATFLVRRPDELATDTASVLPAVTHALEEAETKLSQSIASFVLLQATSPTRTVEDILGATASYEEHSCPSIVSGSSARSSPYFSMVEEKADGTIELCKTPENPIVRRQDAPRCFDLNGSIYVINRKLFATEERIIWPETRLYEMSHENSVDIDTQLDFDLAELILTKRYPAQT